MQKSHAKPEGAPISIPRRLDPEDAQQALQELQAILRRKEVVDAIASRQDEDEEQTNVLEGMLQRQHETEIGEIVNGLHPADIAFILESLPVAERQAVWELVNPEHDADVLLEIDDRSEEHTSELQSLMRSSYAVFCLKKKKQKSTYVKTHIRN